MSVLSMTVEPLKEKPAQLTEKLHACLQSMHVVAEYWAGSTLGVMLSSRVKRQGPVFL